MWVWFLFQLHFVHWNSSKYSSFSEAVDKKDGLAVIGVMIEVCTTLVIISGITVSN